MTPAQKKRGWIILILTASAAVAIGLVLYALSQNINLFFTPTQVAAGEAPTNRAFRLGGMVVKGSVKRASDSLNVKFDLTDFSKTVTVEYNGILPDLFREGQGIVTEGALFAPGQFRAKTVLAKHDENYMPPEVAKSLKR
jgi:cytochrome c-type biogenesis protein CcmE